MVGQYKNGLLVVSPNVIGTGQGEGSSDGAQMDPLSLWGQGLEALTSFKNAVCVLKKLMKECSSPKTKYKF